MSRSRTVLLFGELNEQGVPQAALAHFGSEAYEHYMVAPYVRELMMVRKSDYLCWSPCFEHLYAAILALGAGPVQFEELGSTLFSTIDKLEKLDSVHRSLARRPRINFVGIEVSQLLMDLAEALHHGASLAHFPTWQAVPRHTPDIVSRSYQSTSYAFGETSELFEWISTAKFGIHGVWWCVDGGEREISAAGNAITLFDPDRFDALARENGHHLKVLKSELYSYGDVRFSASWVMLSKLAPHEAKEMDALLESMKLEPAPSVCSLGRSDLLEQSYAGAHAGFVPIHTDAPFDFCDDQLMSRWERYCRGE